MLSPKEVLLKSSRNQTIIEDELKYIEQQLIDIFFEIDQTVKIVVKNHSEIVTNYFLSGIITKKLLEAGWDCILTKEPGKYQSYYWIVKAKKKVWENDNSTKST
jgi:hypothetical protein